MRKRSLHILLISITCIFIIGIVCFSQNHKFGINNSKADEKLIETTTATLSTTKNINTTSFFILTTGFQNTNPKNQTINTKPTSTEKMVNINTEKNAAEKNTIVNTTITQTTHAESTETSLETQEVETVELTETITDFVLTEEPETEEIIPEISEIPEEENNAQTDISIEDLNDCILIENNVIPIAYGPATQEMIDNNDVVQDTELLSNDQNKYFFGHYTGSFSCLHKVKVGDIITVKNDGIETQYTVFRSERGELTDDRINIKSVEDGTYLILTDFKCETIRLITCSAFNPGRYRIVVIAKKNE